MLSNYQHPRLLRALARAEFLYRAVFTLFALDRDDWGGPCFVLIFLLKFLQGDHYCCFEHM